LMTEKYMRQTVITATLMAIIGFGIPGFVAASQIQDRANEAVTQAGEAMTQAGEAVSNAAQHAARRAGEMTQQASEMTQQAAQQAQAKAEEFAREMEKNKKAQDARDGILGWIYMLAELMAFKAFHWLAFMLMIAGVVSWSGQVIIAKLVVGASSSTFDYRETISDSVVLAISLIGLVLTTQAAASSGFTASTVAVLSATAVGAVLGLVLYWWGQALELEAAKK
jgi:heme/copper-type cytochrome/quinol oxidase subunit 3